MTPRPRALVLPSLAVACWGATISGHLGTPSSTLLPLWPALLLAAMTAGLVATWVRARRELDRLEVRVRAAEEANRAKREFLADISHEIRAPLTAVRGFAELLRTPGLDERERIGHVETILRNSDQLLAIVDDILDLSKIEAGRLELERIPCSTLDVVADVAGLMRLRALDKGLAFTFTVVGRIPARITSDPTRLRQVLVNLVGNAIKFTARGEVEIVVRYDARSSSMCFEIADTGIGLCADQLARLFMPFTQGDSSTTRRFGGTGLGLSISKRLARALGGDLEVRSEVGVGSSFMLRIAADVTELVEASELLPTPPYAAANEIVVVPAGLRVLLAEDDVDTQRLVTTYLRLAGATVTVVENGRDAVAAASTDARFDVVVLDMQLPVLDGYAAAAELRRRGSTLPIVALTARAMAGDRERCLAAGCIDYLTKPIVRTQLLGIVAAHAPRSIDGTAPLGSSYADDPDMRELIAEFLVGLGGRLAELDEAAAREDLPRLRRIAHQLKGAAGGYGYTPITDAAAALELECDDGSPPLSRRAAVVALQHMCARAIATPAAA